MDNIFDGLKKIAVDIVSDTMGYDATWTPSTGGDENSARVLFRKPSVKETFVKNDYKPFDYYCEYREPFFPGLLEAVRKGGAQTETITIQGQTYWVKAANRINDGQQIALQLMVKNT